MEQTKQDKHFLHILETGEAYTNFINSINSDYTRNEYRKKIKYFTSFVPVSNFEQLLDLPTSQLESRIRDFIIYLRHDRKLAPASVSSYLGPIAHFYEMNDVSVNWKKLKKFKAKQHGIVEDKPYTREQIKQMVDLAPLRDKIVILLMASAGLRRGALPHLRIRDLTKIAKYGLHKINVYKKEQEQYTTYCTPECSGYIDQYLNWRTRLGEQLQPNSPLIRTKFDPVTQANQPRALSQYTVSYLVNMLLNDTGIRPIVTGGQGNRSELMQNHGFRKFFNTICLNHNMNPLYAEYLMGHKTGLTKAYFKPTDEELLEGNDQSLGYAAMIPFLTINATEQEIKVLREQLAIRDAQHSAEWELLRARVDEIRQKIGFY
jgi:integrase